MKTLFGRHLAETREAPPRQNTIPVKRNFATLGHPCWKCNARQLSKSLFSCSVDANLSPSTCSTALHKSCVYCVKCRSPEGRVWKRFQPFAPPNKKVFCSVPPTANEYHYFVAHGTTERNSDLQSRRRAVAFLAPEMSWRKSNSYSSLC